MTLSRQEADAHFRSGGTALRAGRFPEAVAEFERSRQIYRALGHAAETARCTALLGGAYGQLGRLDDAERELCAARDRWARLGRPRDVAACLAGLSGVYAAAGRYAEADRALLDVAEFHREQGELDLVVELTVHRAEILGNGARYAEAEELLLGLVADLVRGEPGERLADCSLRLGEIYRATGRFTAAERAMDHALGIYRQLGLVKSATECRVSLAALYTAQGRYGHAARTLAAMASSRALLTPTMQEVHLSTQAELHLQAGRFDDAERCYRAARGLAEQLGLRRSIAAAMVGLGNVYALTGEYAAAEGALDEAGELLAGLGLDRDLADCLADLGHVYLSTGRFDRALEAVRTARDLFGRHGVRDRYAACTADLGYIHVPAGRYAEAERELAEAAAAYRRLGVPEYAARCDSARASAMFFLARPMAPESAERRELIRAAIAIMAPAMLFLDATRFQFAHAADRAAWAAVHRDAMSRLFRMGAALGDAVLVADLVESAVNSGVHVAGDSAAPDAVRPGPVPDSAGTTPVAGGARLIAGAVLPMLPPPELVLSGGYRVLSAFLADLDERYRPIERATAPIRAW